MEEKQRIAILGAGGLGANAAMMAAAQGMDVLLIDADVSDEKFFKRFLFFGGRPKLLEGLPKVDVVQRTAQIRGLHIQIINSMVDENFNFDQLKGRRVVIAVDTAGAREIIEALCKKHELEYSHVGCNLGSASLWQTMNARPDATDVAEGEVLSTDPAPDAATSYDRVPDALTYLVTGVSLLQSIVPTPVAVWQGE